MGFTSGKLWATANVGATSPEKKGNYYAWGETGTKNTYTWDNYAYYETYSSGVHRYSYIDTDDIGGMEVPVITGAYADNGGGAYEMVDEYCVDPAYNDTRFIQNNKNYYSRMPSQSDFQELLNNTTQAAATVNGVTGVMFTSKKNGNKLFFPYSGSYYDGKTPANNTVTYYWTSTAYANDSKKAWAVKLASGAASMTQCQHRTGLAIRACAYPASLSVPSYAPTSIDENRLTMTSDSASSPIYTLQGIKVEGDLKPGIYVKNGRKFVVK